MGSGRKPKHSKKDDFKEYPPKRVHRKATIPVSKRYQCSKCLKLYTTKRYLREHLKTKHGITEIVVSRKKFREEQGSKADQRVIFRNFVLSVIFTGQRSCSDREWIRIQLKGKEKYEDPVSYTITVENPLAKFTSAEPVSFIAEIPRTLGFFYQHQGSFQTNVFNFFRLANGVACNRAILDTCVTYLTMNDESVTYLGVFNKVDNNVEFEYYKIKQKMIPISKVTKHVLVVVQYKKEDMISHFFLVAFYMIPKIAKIYDSAPSYYKGDHRNLAVSIAEKIDAIHHKDHGKHFCLRWKTEVVRTATQERDGPCGAFVVYFIHQLVLNKFRRAPPETEEKIVKAVVAAVLIKTVVHPQSKLSAYGKCLKTVLLERDSIGDNMFKKRDNGEERISNSDRERNVERQSVTKKPSSSSTLSSKSPPPTKPITSETVTIDLPSFYRNEDLANNDESFESSSEESTSSDEDLFEVIHPPRSARRNRNKSYKEFFKKDRDNV